MSIRLVVLFAFAFTAVAQTISFLPTNAVASGGAIVVSQCSGCVAVADFNGDGKMDIAFNILQPVPQGGVLLGNGDATFRLALPLSYPTTGPLLVGDFNGDGKPDLVFANTTATVYLGNGDGTFGSPINVSACSGTSAGGVVTDVAVQVGDFNRDGRTDILCGTSVLLSNGDGSFSAAGVAGTAPMETVVLVADFNGDGVPDVLLRGISGNLAVVLGRGDGTFGSELALNYALPPNTYRKFLAGDFNGDGKIDLIDFSTGNGYIDFLQGNGDGTFGNPIQTDISGSPTPGDMTATGDFNQDGKLDFVAGDAVFGGNGDGTFRFPVFFGPTASQCQDVETLDPIFPFSCPYAHGSTAVGDFNGDGLPDLVAYVVNEFPMMGAFIYHVGEADVLLNDSPGNGFTAAGISAATGTGPVGSGSIVSAYGVNLAPETAIAATNPAPTSLGGIRLHVRDRTHQGDVLAPLLYVSPTQINYVLNDYGFESLDLYAWVDIEWIGKPYVPQGMVVPTVALAPDFFAATYTVSAPGYLSLYGTGFAQALTNSSSCTVGGVTATVTYAGSEVQIAGLDQVNMFLPSALAGAGVQPVSCLFASFQGAGTSNTFNVTIH